MVEEMEKTDTFSYKILNTYILGGFKKLEANIFKSLI